MEQKITYYAVVDDFSSHDKPVGVLRRIEHESGERDEQFGYDLAWTRSPLLYSHERGNGDNEIYEITEDEANRIVDRIRGSVTGEIG
jgi:hypothetical protein